MHRVGGHSRKNVCGLSSMDKTSHTTARSETLAIGKVRNRLETKLSDDSTPLQIILQCRKSTSDPKFAPTMPAMCRGCIDAERGNVRTQLQKRKKDAWMIELVGVAEMEIAREEANVDLYGMIVHFAADSGTSAATTKTFTTQKEQMGRRETMRPR